MIRHLDKFGDVGAWQQMSISVVVDFYIKRKWSELSRGRNDIGLPERETLVAELNAVFGEGERTGMWRADSFVISIPETGDVNCIHLNRKRDFYYVDGLQFLSPAEIARALAEISRSLVDILSYTGALSDKALTKLPRLGPHYSEEISPRIYQKVREEIRTSLYVPMGNIECRKMRELIDNWVIGVYELLVQEAMRDHGECCMGCCPTKDEFISALEDSGVVIIRRGEEERYADGRGSVVIYVGGIRYLLRLEGDIVRGYWVDTMDYASDCYVETLYDGTSNRLPSIHVLKELAMLISINQEKIREYCKQEYIQLNKDLKIRQIEDTIQNAKAGWINPSMSLPLV